tara:strand:+ start:2342 stop:3046 length:705 start_codon:yes stop_codon:yes gene_type:complete
MKDILNDKFYLPSTKGDFYKTGVYPLQNEFKNFSECEKLLELVEKEKREYVQISKDIESLKQTWKHIPVIEEYKIVDQLLTNDNCKLLVNIILQNFPSRIKTLTFYKAKKGLLLHRHRDMSGNLMFGKLRIHIPIITNPDCYYLISKDGSDYLFHAWEKGCFVLDTGYIHGVLNSSKYDRVHLMVELHMNDYIWKMLPKKNINWYLHFLNFIFVLTPTAMVKRLYKKLVFDSNL